MWASVRTRHRCVFCLGLLLALLTSLTGCGPSYQKEVVELRTALDQRSISGALAAANQALGVDSSDQMPSVQDPLVPLLLLERGALLHARGEYEKSARDLQMADPSLEVIDMEESTASDLAEFLFSDARANYETPPYEKVMLNTLNMLNYLAMGDLSGARVEARRLGVLEEYYGLEAESRMMVLGAYLAGFTYEMSGRLGDASLWYKMAAEQDMRLAQQALAALAEVRPSDDAAAQYAEKYPDASQPGENEGDILVVVESGRAPYYIAKRVPIGVALTLASTHMSPRNREQANRLAVEGLFKWVNYPELVAARRQSPRDATVRINGKLESSEFALDVERQAGAYYQRIEGRLAVAAITRLITRTIAAQGTEAAISRGESGSQALAGFLVGKVVEGAMIAADMPDTRSWNSLPAYYTVTRARVPAGKHTVEVSINGRTETYEVEVWPRGYATVVVHDL